jgi:hypothetical protein
MSRDPPFRFSAGAEAVAIFEQSSASKRQELDQWRDLSVSLAHQDRAMDYIQELLSQRIYGLVLGYEDLNDHDHLRRDPVHGLICGKRDPLGQDRVLERDKGKALAAHSTLNRLELSAQGIDLRYRKIEAQPEEIEALLIKRGVKAIPRKSTEIVLDFDATDDPLHGSQQGAYFNGYYREYCYLPLYCFCGNIPLLAKLRDCKRDASDGTLEALQKIVSAIRRRFGKKVRIIVRADSGFAREPIMSWCEDNEVFYCFGLARNDRLSEELKGAFESLNGRIKEGKLESPCRSFTEFEYSTLQSWSKARRVIGKAEILPKGDNPRFVVTNLPKDGWGDPAQRARFQAAALYEKFYCARGDMENRIMPGRRAIGQQSRHQGINRFALKNLCGRTKSSCFHTVGERR